MDKKVNTPEKFRSDKIFLFFFCQWMLTIARERDKNNQIRRVRAELLSLIKNDNYLYVFSCINIKKWEILRLIK